ncbi:MAG: hypothetical protein DRI57_14375 [Deltaproteobacteria bacterium]|nr:MAG: hypothetical protein DRI57_14375 [Deltaproteobacteria bacterium]
MKVRMFIVKHAERRFWTKSQARQDAHELLTEVFKLEWQRNRKRNLPFTGTGTFTGDSLNPL